MEQLERLRQLLDEEIAPSLVHSVDAINGVGARLLQAEEGLTIAQQLLAVHRGLKEAASQHLAGNYLDAARSLKMVRFLKI